MPNVIYGAMTFAEKLAIAMEARGLSQMKLGELTGIHQTAISRMTRGGDTQRPYLDQGLLIAKALNVPLEYLADDLWDEEPAPPRELQREVWGLVLEMGLNRARKRLLLLERPATEAPVEEGLRVADIPSKAELAASEVEPKRSDKPGKPMNGPPGR